MILPIDVLKPIVAVDFYDKFGQKVNEILIKCKLFPLGNLNELNFVHESLHKFNSP